MHTGQIRIGTRKKKWGLKKTPRDGSLKIPCVIMGDLLSRELSFRH